ncbi:hypothetical protein ACFOEK_08515 [Litoribrevibacter euphylliae]|uniref:Uncharacterized protein n=1 Tax=Litoribrevibacter euphylliae TaxID=1834034 RepID=A0ABV7HAX1_9GAMM
MHDVMGNHYLFCNQCDAPIDQWNNNLRYVKDSFFARHFLFELVTPFSSNSLFRELYQYVRPYDHQLRFKSDDVVMEDLIHMLGSEELQVWLLFNEHFDNLPDHIYEAQPMAGSEANSSLAGNKSARASSPRSNQGSSGSGQPAAASNSAKASVHESGSAAAAGVTGASSKAVLPSNLVEAKVILEQRRKQIAATGYQPKYSDKELEHMAQHGDVGAERFQVRFMETNYLSSPKEPTEHLSGAMGRVMKGETGEGAKYWSTSLDQLEDADTDPQLICEKLGLTYDQKADYCLVIVDTQKAVPMTGVKSVSATFENVSEFANTELPEDFPKSFTDETMTPKFQEKYAQHYKAADQQEYFEDEWSSKSFDRYLNSTDLSKADKKLMKQRFDMHGTIGNNEDYLGNGLTKNNNPSVDQKYGVVETLNFERQKINLAQLDQANAISIIPSLRPV